MRHLSVPLWTTVERQKEARSNPENACSDERIYRLATVAVSTVIVYGSLVPFDFSRPQAINSLGLLALLRFVSWSHLSATDRLVNIAVGVPLGFVLMGALLAGRRRSAVAVAVAVLVVGWISAMLGTAVEMLQVFSPTRQSSWNDVMAQAFGASVGALVWPRTGRAVIQWLRNAANERASYAFAVPLLQIYLPIYLLVQLTPFDSGRAAELATKYKQGGGALMPSMHFVDSTFVVWLNAAGNALLTIPIGVLAVLGWASRGTRRTVGWAVLLGASVVLAVGIAQQFVWRHASVSQFLVGTVGIMIGVATARVVSRPRIRKSIGQSRLVHPWFLVAAGAWMLVLVGHSWYPFDFDLTSEIMSRRLTWISVIPFAFYYWYASYVVSPLLAVHEALLQFLLAVPLGLLLRFAWPVADERRVRRFQSVAIIGIATIVLVGIELGQMFLPTRFPDVTDVLMGAIGAMVGAGAATALARRQSFGDRLSGRSVSTRDTMPSRGERRQVTITGCASSATGRIGDR